VPAAAKTSIVGKSDHPLWSHWRGMRQAPGGIDNLVAVPVEGGEPSSRRGPSILQAQPNQAETFTQKDFVKYRG
jgi:hypothetical protein